MVLVQKIGQEPLSTNIRKLANTIRTTVPQHRHLLCSEASKNDAPSLNNIITESLEKNDRKPFWRYTKAKKQDNIGIAPLRHKGSMTNDSKEKANILNDQFKSVFTKTMSTTLEKSTIDRGFNIKTLKIGEQGVFKLLTDINPSKAMGPDQIPNIVLKTCAKTLAPGMTKIFQKSIDCSEPSDDWLNTNVAPVYKKGDVHQAENYRPVSLTSVICKLLEHIICKHILTVAYTPGKVHHSYIFKPWIQIRIFM
jgi:hypothetical protein